MSSYLVAPPAQNQGGYQAGQVQSQIPSQIVVPPPSQTNTQSSNQFQFPSSHPTTNMPLQQGATLNQNPFQVQSQPQVPLQGQGGNVAQGNQGSGLRLQAADRQYRERKNNDVLRAGYFGVVNGANMYLSTILAVLNRAARGSSLPIESCFFPPFSKGCCIRKQGNGFEIIYRVGNKGTFQNDVWAHYDARPDRARPLPGWKTGDLFKSLFTAAAGDPDRRRTIGQQHSWLYKNGIDNPDLALSGNPGYSGLATSVARRLYLLTCTSNANTKDGAQNFDAFKMTRGTFNIETRISNVIQYLNSQLSGAKFSSFSGVVPVDEDSWISNLPLGKDPNNADYFYPKPDIAAMVGVKSNAGKKGAFRLLTIALDEEEATVSAICGANLASTLKNQDVHSYAGAITGYTGEWLVANPAVASILAAAKAINGASTVLYVVSVETNSLAVAFKQGTMASIRPPEGYIIMWLDNRVINGESICLVCFVKLTGRKADPRSPIYPVTPIRKNALYYNGDGLKGKYTKFSRYVGDDFTPGQNESIKQVVVYNFAVSPLAIGTSDALWSTYTEALVSSGSSIAGSVYSSASGSSSTVYSRAGGQNRTQTNLSSQPPPPPAIPLSTNPPANPATIGFSTASLGDLRPVATGGSVANSDISSAFDQRVGN